MPGARDSPRLKSRRCWCECATSCARPACFVARTLGETFSSCQRRRSTASNTEGRLLTSSDSLQDDFLTSDLVAGDLLVSVLDRLAARLDRQRTTPAGYILRRMLLVNYWHFDFE